MIVFIGNILDFIDKNSARSNIEYSQFNRLIQNGSPITFYNYECPIRSNLKPYSDLEFICEWQSNIDKTRLIKNQNLEKRFVDNVILPLKQINENIRYFKFLADLNPILLYPETINSNEKRKNVKRIMLKTERELQNEADKLFGCGTITIFRFSQIYEIFEKEYLEIYNKIKYSFKDEKSSEIPISDYFKQKTFRNLLDELQKHCGIQNQPLNPRFIELGKRVASSYATEETIIRNFLSKESWFENPVAVPNESLFTLPALANGYLGKEKRGTWIFVNGGIKNEN
ncbi:MAG: hypothetical protein KJ949_02025 [Nanoarchaeota archaeon]|nr:hypothetical protein [Nanoarchaeota archaeon]